MSKERARRRAEREAAATALAERRAAEAERTARRAERRDRLTGWLPRATGGRPTGVLAEKRRRQTFATFGLLVVLNLLVYALARDPGLSGLLLVASVLGAPIVHMMLFRRTT